MAAVAATLSSDQLERDPVVCCPVFIVEELRRTVLVIDENVDPAVVVDVSGRQSPRYRGNSQVAERPRIGHFAEPAVSIVMQQLLALLIAYALRLRIRLDVDVAVGDK